MADALARSLRRERRVRRPRRNKNCVRDVRGGFDNLAGGRGNGARLIVDIAIAAEVTGIVKHDLFLVLAWTAAVEFAIARQEFAVVLDWRWRAELFPVFLNRANTVRADGDDLFHLVLAE